MTRIDMLIAIYDKTAQALQTGVSAIEQNDPQRLDTAKIRACQYLIALLDGLNADHDETAKNIQRLLHYSIRLVWSGNKDEWEAASRIVGRLHSSFSQIRDTAVQMELKGEIPPLDFSVVYDEAVA